jgi:hypothetical protein
MCATVRDSVLYGFSIPELLRSLLHQLRASVAQKRRSLTIQLACQAPHWSTMTWSPLLMFSMAVTGFWSLQKANEAAIKVFVTLHICVKYVFILGTAHQSSVCSERGFLVLFCFFFLRNKRKIKRIFLKLWFCDFWFCEADKNIPIPP